jgi:small subunit ribosomal protein S3
VPLHTIRADIDYGFTEAKTTMGRIGIKVWIYKGDILPERKKEEVEEVILESAAEQEVGTAPVAAEAAPVAETKVEEAAPNIESAEEEKPKKPAARTRKKTSDDVEEKTEKPAARKRAKVEKETTKETVIKADAETAEEKDK